MERDTKFTVEFRKIIGDEGTECVLLPPKSPNCNAFIERFFLSLKSECLDKMISFGESSLRNATRQFVEHYHTERNLAARRRQAAHPHYRPHPSRPLRAPTANNAENSRRSTNRTDDSSGPPPPVTPDSPSLSPPF